MNGLKERLGLALAVVAVAGTPVVTAQAQGQRQAGTPQTFHTKLNLYRDTNYNGEMDEWDNPSSAVHTDWPIRSIGIHPGDRWQICGRPRFRDPCIVLDRSVPDANMVGVTDQIGSARLVEGNAAPAQSGGNNGGN